MFVGDGLKPDKRNDGCIATRYKQIGNAVAPPVAGALGRCLLLAAALPAPIEDIPVVPVPDPEMTAVSHCGGCTLGQHLGAAAGLARNSGVHVWWEAGVTVLLLCCFSCAVHAVMDGWVLLL